MCIFFNLFVQSSTEANTILIMFMTNTNRIAQGKSTKDSLWTATNWFFSEFKNWTSNWKLEENDTFSTVLHKYMPLFIWLLRNVHNFKKSCFNRKQINTSNRDCDVKLWSKQNNLIFTFLKYLIIYFPRDILCYRFVFYFIRRKKSQKLLIHESPLNRELNIFTQRNTSTLIPVQLFFHTNTAFK